VSGSGADEVARHPAFGRAEQAEGDVNFGGGRVGTGHALSNWVCPYVENYSSILQGYSRKKVKNANLS
jgi:hypothetical protein